MADSLIKRSYPPEKETDDNDDEFCLTVELATIVQTDDDSDMYIGTMYMTEVPDKEDLEPNNMTEQTDTVDIQHTDLVSMVNDIEHNKNLVAN